MLYLDRLLHGCCTVRYDNESMSYYKIEGVSRIRNLPTKTFLIFAHVVLHSEPISNMFINDVQPTTVELEYFEMVYGKEVKDSLLVLLGYLYNQSIAAHRNQQSLI